MLPQYALLAATIQPFIRPKEAQKAQNGKTIDF